MNDMKSLENPAHSTTRAFLNQISVDGHKLIVIASDGSPFVAVVVESLYVHSGERYDFILHASQTVGNFWIRFQGTEFGCGGAMAYGVR